MVKPRWSVYDIMVRLGALFVALEATLVAGDVMTNTWLVRLHGEPGIEGARSVAARNGFSFVRPVSAAPILSVFTTQEIHTCLCCLWTHTAGRADKTCSNQEIQVFQHRHVVSISLVSREICCS